MDQESVVEGPQTSAFQIAAFIVGRDRRLIIP
jgi:hypothetical protein